MLNFNQEVFFFTLYFSYETALMVLTRILLRIGKGNFRKNNCAY